MESYHKDKEKYKITDSEDEVKEELNKVAPSLSHISLSIPGVASQIIVGGASMTTEFVEFLTEQDIEEAVKYIKEAMEDKI